MCAESLAGAGFFRRVADSLVDTARPARAGHPRWPGNRARLFGWADTWSFVARRKFAPPVGPNGTNIQMDPRHRHCYIIPPDAGVQPDVAE